MNEEKATEILKEWIQDDEGLDGLHRYVSWWKGRKEITLDDSFSVEELEAMIWWMKNKNT